MKKSLCLFTLLILTFCAAGCSTEPDEISGRLIEYHTVEEYVAPIATVVDGDGRVFYVAMLCDTVTGLEPYDAGKALREGKLLNVDIRVRRGEAGKKVRLNGETVTVYQAYWIDILDDP